jgi:hypothetical protein
MFIHGTERIASIFQENMAIYGIGAYYDGDVSRDFIEANLVGIGWENIDAADLHQLVKTMKVGDIVYLKSFSPSSPHLIVKAIGLIVDDEIRTWNDSNNLVSCGRNVRWLSTRQIRIPKPSEKNNVRANSVYEEFHPRVQEAILNQIHPADPAS